VNQIVFLGERVLRCFFLRSTLFTIIFVAALHAVSFAAPCVNRQELTARQPGVVSRYLVADGQSVKKGDLLVEFDARLQKAGLREAEGALQAAEANVSLADDALKRLDKLKGTDAIADNQLVETRIRLLQASALAKQASGAHERVSIQLEDTRIRAMIAGVVRGLPNVLGLAVQAGQSLGRIEGNTCSKTQ
jgi:RND family efflux transporter MFP subunit